jgi:hypothetical protein
MNFEKLPESDSEKKIKNKRKFLKKMAILGGGIFLGGLYQKNKNRGVDPVNPALGEKEEQIIHTMPELVEEDISNEEICIYIEKLEENEKKELEKCFLQLQEVYKRYHTTDSLTPELVTELSNKFYGLFAKYCKNFKYINKQPSNRTAENLRDTITYKNQEKFSLDDPNRALTENDLFNLNPGGNTKLGNVFILIAELTHSIQKDIPEEGNHFFYDVERAKDSMSQHMDLKKIKTKKERSLRDSLWSHFMYKHASFSEFKAHEVTERAIYFYLLDSPASLKGKTFEEIYQFLSKIYSNIIESSYINSDKEKAKLLSSILRPTVLEYINQHHLDTKNVGKLLKNIDLSVLLNYH